MSNDKITISMDDVNSAIPVPGSVPPPFFTPSYPPTPSEPSVKPKRTGLYIGIGVAVVALLCLAGVGIVAIATSNGGGTKQNAVPPTESPAKTAARLIEEAIAFDHRISQETIGRKATADGVNADCDEEARVRREYVSKMRKFLFSQADLPADFRAILFEHISAHNRFADILGSHPLLPNDFVEGFGIGILNFISGKGVDGGAGEMNQWINEVKISQRKISETWDAVLQCAIKHGVEINQEE